MSIYYVYIPTNWTKSTLYIGITNDLSRRLFEHKSKILKGFSKKYRTFYLIYYESTNDVYSAIEREKQIKRWNRRKKENLIKMSNPEWKELSV